MNYDLAIFYEHPNWHQLIFDELDKLKVNYFKLDLTKGAINYKQIPQAHIYYNMVSPSAYTRNNQKAIPYSQALCRILDLQGKKVLNGFLSNQLEFSKSNQIALLASIGVNYPDTFIFNNIDELIKNKSLHFPMILKPEQGGSGARMYLVNSIEEIVNLFQLYPELWFPDNLFLLQEKIEYDSNFGIIRVEFIEGKMLYAMRIISKGEFNLCPSVVCNPEDGSTGNCELPPKGTKPEFYAYAEITANELNEVTKVFNASKHNTGSIEYLLDKDKNQIFYDINANSNLRPSIGNAFGINPFEEIAKYLKNNIENQKN